MRKYLPYLILLLISISFKTYAVESSPPPTPVEKKEFSTKSNHQLFNKKNWEAQLGRKLNLRERISLRLLQKRIKKQTLKVPQNDQEARDGFAIGGMIAGLLGVLLSILLAPLAAVILGVIAIVLSAIGMNRTEGLKGFRKKGRRMAITGLVLGILVTVFWLGIISILLATLGG